MKIFHLVLVVTVAVIVGLPAGTATAKKPEVGAQHFVDMEMQVAAETLGEIAFQQAGSGTWQRIRVARVFFLSGEKEKGQAIFDAILGDKPDPGDWVRIGRVYYEAGHWDEARAAFEKVLELKPKDADWLAEIGAYFNLQGDRDRAEELFSRSFREEPKNHRNTAYAAGSYVGVVPDP